MSTELSSLLKLIAAGIETIESSLDGAKLPSINDPEVPSILSDPRFVQSSSLVLAAASRLIASLQNPHLAMMESSAGMYTTAILNIVAEANVTEALREAGPQGLHVRDLGEKVGVEPVKLARCLRYLCARHIYREISPNVFANNRLSIVLDTGLPFDQVKERDPHRYDTASGVASLVTHTSDEGLKGASVFSDILLDSKQQLGSTNAPVMQAAKFDGDFFQWIEQPGNEKRLHRFGAAMKSLAKMLPAELTLGAYDWQSLPKGSLVVDVGGGFGAVTMPLAKQFSDLRFVVQDRPAVIAGGEKFWESEFPGALDSKHVELKAHDFFGPQTIKDASVFMLRFIIHDWPDDKARAILQRLRDAATPSTKLLLLEQILQYTSAVDDELVSTIPGAATPPLPPVLSGNLGAATSFTFMADIQMLNFGAAQERTIREWYDLLTSSGWKLEEIRRGPVNSIICAPA